MKGIKITYDKQVEEVELNGGLEELQAIVEGMIELVTLSDGSTMWVNEEFRLIFGLEKYNSIASDVAGLGGRTDLMLHGILGNVVIVGPGDEEGYSTDVTDQARDWVCRVAREA